MNYITDQEIDKLQGNMGARLAAEPKVKLIIKEDGSEYWEGGINGYFFRVRRGETVELPKSLARLIERNRQVTAMGEERVRAYKGNGGRRIAGGEA